MAAGGDHRVVATNRKARREYEILETLEAGIVLRGPEVKSVREGQVGFQDAFARIVQGEVILFHLHINPYEKANRFNVDPMRERKLLLHAQEIRRLIGKVEEKGLTLIPLELYFSGPYAKVKLGLARGRQLHDKRQQVKERDQQREARRAKVEQGR